MSNLGAALFVARTQKKLTLAQVSVSSGLEESTIWRVEQGKTDPRFSSQLIPLVNALGLKLPAFLASLNRTKGIACPPLKPQK
jgi:transcriptional regulator with XRE-family HTH domain